MSQQHVDAITLAGWGFKVFPLHPRGKAPIYNGGFHNATTDLAQVDQWWEKHPEANIGARVFAGHVVVDIDPRHGGDIRWAQITKGHTLPRTLTIRTGSGGWHLWYKLPHTGATYGHLSGDLTGGVDLKADTGYLVMPGSTHPHTGKIYRCTVWASPAMLPKFLEEHVYKPAPRPVTHLPMTGTGDGTGVVRTMAEAVEGQRNHILFWAACKNYEEGLNIIPELTAAAQGVGLADQEIQRTIRSAEQKIRGVAA